MQQQRPCIFWRKRRDIAGQHRQRAKDELLVAPFGVQK
jgi:hypothetical protein